MSTVVTTAYIAAVRTVRVPRGTTAVAIPQAANVTTRIEDGYRHQAISSLQALGLAIATSVLLTGLMWVAL